MKRLSIFFLLAIFLASSPFPASAVVNSINGQTDAAQLLVAPSSSATNTMHMEIVPIGSDRNRFRWDGTPWRVDQGGTGVQSVPSGALLFGNGTGALGMTYAPTFSFVTATSTSATSSLQNLSTAQLSIESLQGVVKAVNGFLMSGLIDLASEVSGVLGVGFGGTGTIMLPSFGQLLMGNGLGGYDLVSTSSLNISAAAIPGGSNGHIQFNDNGTFGGMAISYFQTAHQRILKTDSAPNGSGYLTALRGADAVESGAGGRYLVAAGDGPDGQLGATIYLFGGSADGSGDGTGDIEFYSGTISDSETPGSFKFRTWLQAATTTIDFGEIGNTDSRVCFNTKNTDGQDISFYFVGTSMVIEANPCL
ncbi:MAG: hypothetical protein AAB573_00140 [Patescibacteria group bacterium]